MDETLHSSLWYRVAHLRPRLRSHIRIHRHHYRGQLWYVLQDRMSGRYNRFSPSAYLLISLMDGRRTVQQIWDKACGELGDDVLTQNDVIRLLSQLHHADALQSDVLPDTEGMADRATKLRQRKKVLSFINPIAIRIPLFDPDEFLGATMALARPAFSWIGALLIFGTIAYGIVLAALHWTEITGNITDRVFATENLLVLFITYPLIKAFHELGHGYAVKRWGGEVHEIGVMLLVFMPVPYVDASAAAAFRSKWARALVGSAGIIVEMLLAALALIFWVEMEEGFTRTLLYNVMLIGGVSTLLFNGNPLLRFDGYYVFADLLEIPNLGIRSNRYLGYLIQRYGFGVKEAKSPVTAPREAGWLFFYSIASFVYRMFLVSAIVLLIASKFFFVGVFLAVWACIMMLGFPIAKAVWFVLASPVLRRNRERAFAVCALVAAALATLLAVIPVPHSTVAEAVVWVPGSSVVHAKTGGVVTEVLAPIGERATVGEPLLRLEDPFLEARVGALEARAKALQLRLAAARVTDVSEAAILALQTARAEADLQREKQRQSDLWVKSHADGTFVVRSPNDLIGKFVRQGDVIGHLVDQDQPTLRVLIPEDSIDLVRERTRKLEVRFADRADRVLAAEVIREVPLVSDRLPSVAFSTAGGGEIMMDPTNPENAKALTKTMQMEIRLANPPATVFLGSRVYVRFYHGERPLAERIYLDIRQLFLRRFLV